MKTIKIAGVPEHFNLPWHLAIDNGDFEKENIDLQWTDVPEGTGKMCQMLRLESTRTLLFRPFRARVAASSEVSPSLSRLATSSFSRPASGKVRHFRIPVA